MPALRLARAPRTDNELHLLIKAMWGVDLPRVGVCEGHTSPFAAVAHAYFAKDPHFAVWYASRGSGKSLALAVLGLTKTFVADADCTILGGSSWQSANVRDHMSRMLKHPNAPAYAVERDIATVIETTTGKQIKPLPASQTSVRGPHPPLQLLDEIDEMEYKIYEAALGQAMEQLNTRGELVGEYIVASSTWQNPIGCVLYGTLIATLRGDVAIQDVKVGDLVPTNDGWRPVTHVHDTGRQECVTVTFESGRELTCTPWHPVWTDSGFVEASLLAVGTLVSALVIKSAVAPFTGMLVDTQAATAPVAGACLLNNDRAFDGQVMTVRADGPGSLGRAGVVLLDRDRLEVPWVDAGSVGAAPAAGAVGVPVVAEMVDMDAIGQPAVELLPDPLVGRDDALGVTAVALDAVAVLHDPEGPPDAVVGIEIDDPVFAHDKVVHVSHHTLVLPTWDLTVKGQPEYVANGILVHNTMTTVIEDARSKGLPVFTWCWRELLVENGGWMTKRFIESKKRTVSAAMWRTEYELNEPAATSRAFDLDKIDEYFVEYPAPVKEKHAEGGNDDFWIWELPDPLGSYCAGADWAKDVDKTVLAVIRTDVMPRRLAALRRMNRMPYPEMTGAYTDLVRQYNNAESLHDKTGVGNGLNDYLGEDARSGYVLVGRKRAQLFSDYIADFEHGGYLLPKKLDEKDAFYKGHRGATVADVFAPTAWDEHTPDDVVAMALAHHAAGRAPIPSELPDMPKDHSPRTVDKPFHVKPDTGRVDGLVQIVDDYDGDDMLASMSVELRGGDGSDVSGWLR